MVSTQERKHIWQLCEDCADNIYTMNQPSPSYSLAVAQMLYGTACKESDLRHRRQTVFDWDGTRGAFSLWQVEYGSMETSINWLKKKPDTLERVSQWLFQSKRATVEWVDLDKKTLLYMMRGWDRFGVLFARLHYFRVRQSIPSELHNQAEYWLTFYNCMGCTKDPRSKNMSLDSAKNHCINSYIESWNRYSDGVVI